MTAVREPLIMEVFKRRCRYEAKRLEIETWMQRMESRAERMGTVATTADVLDAQQKEQKVNKAKCQKRLPKSLFTRQQHTKIALSIVLS